MAQKTTNLLNRLTFRQLQVFEAVHRMRSYSRAAEFLGLTQPAVSAQIRQLEQALDQPLFEYAGKTLHITQAGQSLAASVKAVFGEINRLQMSLSEMSGSLKGELKLSSVTSAQYIMPWLIRRFSDLHPEIHIQLCVANRAQALQRLEQQRDDLTILGMAPRHKHMEFLPFLENHLIPVLPSAHPLACRKRLTPEEFLSNPLLVREGGSGTRDIVDEYCTHIRVTPEQTIELGSIEAIKAGLAQEMGVAILPWVSVRRALKQGDLVRPAVRGLPLRRSWSLVHSQQRPLSPAAQAFHEFVSSQLAAMEQAFQPPGPDNRLV